MKAITFTAILLIAAAVLAVLCISACGGEGRPGKEVMIVSLDTAGRIYCSWEPSSSAGPGTVYRVALLLEDGSSAAEFETRETGAWLFDYIARYLQQNGGTDITFTARVQAYNDGKFFARGNSDTVTLKNVIPSANERVIGRDIALDDIVSFSYSGNADYIEGIFGFYVYKAAYGADYEYSLYGDDGRHTEGETELSPEDWRELCSMLEGLAVTSRYFEDPEVHELDGGYEQMRITWLDMPPEDSHTELKADRDTVLRIEAWLKQKAENAG